MNGTITTAPLASLRVSKAAFSRIDRIVAHASKPEHWSYATGEQPDDAEKNHAVRLGDVICMFSWTVCLSNHVHRHLTMTVDTKNSEYPPPPVCFSVANHFGFTGGEVGAHGFIIRPAEDWDVRLEEEDNKRYVVIMQLVRALDAKGMS